MKAASIWKNSSARLSVVVWWKELLVGEESLVQKYLYGARVLGEVFFRRPCSRVEGWSIAVKVFDGPVNQHQYTVGTQNTRENLIKELLFPVILVLRTTLGR
jgi:hypothetical protein